MNLHHQPVNESDFIAPVGQCPVTGYPLVAVHDANGCHAGPAIAYLNDVDRTKRHAPAGEAPHPPRLRIEDTVSRAEVFRAWTELLIFAVAERHAHTPDKVEADLRRCHDLLGSRHHYDVARVVAALHIAAIEYLHLNEPWAAPSMVLVPDVGLDNLRTAAQTAVRRLAGSEDALPMAVDLLRSTYLNHLATVA